MAGNIDTPMYEEVDDQEYSCPDHTFDWFTILVNGEVVTQTWRCRTCLSTEE